MVQKYQETLQQLTLLQMAPNEEKVALAADAKHRLLADRPELLLPAAASVHRQVRVAFINTPRPGIPLVFL